MTKLLRLKQHDSCSIASRARIFDNNLITADETVYYDELIAKLARSGYGCRVSQHFVGALSYADDITLLSPSLQGLQYMVNICEEYGK